MPENASSPAPGQSLLFPRICFVVGLTAFALMPGTR